MNGGGLSWFLEKQGCVFASDLQQEVHLGSCVLCKHTQLVSNVVWVVGKVRCKLLDEWWWTELVS
jgi:hypothetical protein